MMRTPVLLTCLTALGVLASRAGASEDPRRLRVAFGAEEVTPDLKTDRPVWLAGYGTGRKATGIHDPLYARCLVLEHGAEKLALVSVDLIGLQYRAVQQIRRGLPDYRYVLVASTHNHEGPDVIGIWGKSPFHRGVDDAYFDSVVKRVTEMIHRTERDLVPAVADYGTACDESLLHDSRQPQVKDGILRTLRFRELSAGRTVGILVQWNCHPEALGDRNTLITADFPAATIAALAERWKCPVAYFSGALGGLMTPPDGRIRGDGDQFLSSGDFEFARRYGLAVADLANQALARAQPMVITPFGVSAKPILVPMENEWYRLARVLGILRREGRIWTGDFEKPGEPITLENADKTHAAETEVACLRLGELHVACIPGEIYPELVYGQVQDPADPGADFPDAAQEPSVSRALPGDRWLLLGMANDEIGYIIPKRQWDNRAPFAYERAVPQYGEINSCGPQTAPIIMEALVRRVRDLEQRGTRE